MSRCADLKVYNFAEGTANYDIVKAIVDHFAAENIFFLMKKLYRCRKHENSVCPAVRKQNRAGLLRGQTGL